MKPRIDFLMMVLATLIFLPFLPQAAAKVVLESDFQGTVVVTAPDGSVTILQPGDPVPEIPQGATLQVAGGDFTVKTDAGDSVNISCMGHAGTVANGAAVALHEDQDAGLIKVLSGPVSLKDEQGNQETLLKTGTEYPIKRNPVAAPATAAGEPLGGAPAGGDLGQPPPVDSRSIESSPSQ